MPSSTVWLTSIKRVVAEDLDTREDGITNAANKERRFETAVAFDRQLQTAVP